MCPGWSPAVVSINSTWPSSLAKAGLTLLKVTALRMGDWKWWMDDSIYLYFVLGAFRSSYIPGSLIHMFYPSPFRVHLWLGGSWSAGQIAVSVWETMALLSPKGSPRENCIWYTLWHAQVCVCMCVNRSGVAFLDQIFPPMLWTFCHSAVGFQALRPHSPLSLSSRADTLICISSDGSWFGF